MRNPRLSRSAWYALRRRRALHPALVANGGPYDVVTVTTCRPNENRDYLIDLLAAGSSGPVTVRFPLSETTADTVQVWISGGKPKPLFRVVYVEAEHPHWALALANVAEKQGPLPFLQGYLDGRKPT